jgi:hypothetical protein
MGIGHGAPGFKWRSAERYKVLDWVSVQYVWSYNQGNVTAWRDQVLSFARQNGVTPMFALNILNGGVTDTNGAWDCPNTGGKGTRTSNCRMTSEQVRTYGRTIGPFGCTMLMCATTAPSWRTPPISRPSRMSRPCSIRSLGRAAGGPEDTGRRGSRAAVCSHVARVSLALFVLPIVLSLAMVRRLALLGGGMRGA